MEHGLRSGWDVERWKKIKTIDSGSRRCSMAPEEDDKTMKKKKKKRAEGEKNAGLDKRIKAGTWRKITTAESRY